MKKKQSLTTIELQKKIIRGILTIGALTLLIIFLFGNHGLYQLYILKKERGNIQDKINLLREEKMALENEKTKLQTDYKHIEELAREKYRMSKKGERVFKVIEKENNN
jgi:cell division protein FtsB